MQMVAKIFISLLVVLLSLAVFAPKRSLYYELEERLMQEDIIISNEEIDTGIFTLTLKHPELYVKGIKVATLEEIELFTLFFYSTFRITNIEVDSLLKRFIPTGIEELRASHQLFDPQNISIISSGPFGKVDGVVSLSERKVHIDLTDEVTDKNLVKKLKAFLKKDEQGGLYYETTF